MRSRSLCLPLGLCLLLAFGLSACDSDSQVCLSCDAGPVMDGGTR